MRKNKDMKKCERCGYTWFPRIQDIRQCPGCHTHKWNVPLEAKVKAILVKLDPREEFKMQ